MKLLEKKRNKALGAGHVGAVGFAKGIEESLLFGDHAATVDVTRDKEEDGNAKPTSEG